MIETRALPELLLTTDELASVLKCSKSKTKELLKTGEIVSILIGGQRRIRTSDLALYLASLEPSLPGDEARSAA